MSSHLTLWITSLAHRLFFFFLTRLTAGLSDPSPFNLKGALGISALGHTSSAEGTCLNAGCHHISLGTNLSVGNERQRERKHIHM